MHNRNISRKINYIPHDSQSDFYDVWVTETNYFKQVIYYYKNNYGVKCYEEGGGAMKVMKNN